MYFPFLSTFTLSILSSHGKKRKYNIFRAWKKPPAREKIRSGVTVQPCTIPRVKSLCMRFCELCQRQNATLEHFVCIRRDSEAEG